jgi:hypothetical protein
MQQLSKRTLKNGATVLSGVRAEELSWKPSALTVQFLSECGGIQLAVRFRSVNI